MQARTVTKLLIEVNILSRFTHESKPASLDTKEIFNEVEDIYKRLVHLNDKISKAKKDEITPTSDPRHPARPPAPVEPDFETFRHHRNAQMGDTVRRGTIYEANNGED